MGKFIIYSSMHVKLHLFISVDQQKYMKSVPQLKYCNTVNKHKGAGRRLHKAQMMVSKIKIRGTSNYLICLPKQTE